MWSCFSAVSTIFAKRHMTPLVLPLDDLFMCFSFAICTIFHSLKKKKFIDIGLQRSSLFF